MNTTRRNVLAGLGIAGAGLAAPAGFAQSKPVPRPHPDADHLLPLWPGRPPGAPAPLPVLKVEQRSSDPAFNDRWLTGIDRPGLTVRRAATPNGAAVMILPGGGYGFLSWDNEGEEQARWLNALGVTCFILSYRLPREGWASRETVPLADAQRGLRLIRANASKCGIDPERIGILGFSAGGHLGGSLATRHAEKVYDPIDAADRVSARPGVAGLIYPVVRLAEAFTGGDSRSNLLGSDQSEARLATTSIDLSVDGETSPMFLAHASDDGLVNVTNSLVLYQAMVAAKRPVELHAFDKGGHGFGARLPKDTPASAWPTLFAAYARRLGVFA